MGKRKSIGIVLIFVLISHSIASILPLPAFASTPYQRTPSPLFGENEETDSQQNLFRYLVPVMTIDEWTAFHVYHAAFLEDDYLFLFYWFPVMLGKKIDAFDEGSDDYVRWVPYRYDEGSDDYEEWPSWPWYGDVARHPNGTIYFAMLGGSVGVIVYDLLSYSYVDSISLWWEGVYRVDSIYPLNVTRVWNNTGFFSGNGAFLVEDASFYGTSARVLDLVSGMIIPIEWKVNATFYSTRISYDGSVIAVGSPFSGLLLVYEKTYDDEWGIVLYRKIFEMSHDLRGSEDRLFLSDDANLIVYAVYDRNYLFFLRRTREYVNSTFSIGGLTIRMAGYYQLFGVYNTGNESITAFSVLYDGERGFVAAGTKQGSAYFFSFNLTRNEVNLISVYRAPQDLLPLRAVYPDVNWKAPRDIPGVLPLLFYSPRRWSYFTLFYFTCSGTTYLYNHTASPLGATSAIAFSPSGRHLFSCDTLFFVIEGDPQSGNPRLRFWGNTVYESTHDVKTHLVFNTPSGRDWHAYFFGGQIKITELVTLSETVPLILDRDYLSGNLGNLVCKRGVEIYSGEFMACGAKLHYSVGDAFIEYETPILPLTEERARELLTRIGVPEEKIPPDVGPEKTLIYSSVHTHRSFYGWGGASMVSSGILIPIRFAAPAPLASFEKVTPVVTAQVAGAAALKDPLSGTVLGVSLGAFATGVGGALALKAGYGALQTLTFGAVSALAHTGAIFWETAMAIGKAIMTAATAFPVLAIAVGTAFAVEAYMIKQYEEAALASYRYFVALAPIIEDRETMRRYVVVAYILPREEILARGLEYEKMGKSLFKCLTGGREENVMIRLVTHGETWREYRRYMLEGRIPQVELVSLVREMISLPFQIPMERLVITGAAFAVQQMTEGKSTLTQYLAGGMRVYTVLIVHGVSIQVGGTVATGIISNPYTIARTLRYIYVNGRPYNFTIRRDGVYVDFYIPDGTTAVVVSFPQGVRGYARMAINLTVVLKKDFDRLGDYGYEVRFHYDWRNTIIRLERIEFVDMEYPLRYAERELIYAAGSRMVTNVTQYFLSGYTSVAPDPSSPSGYRYYYATTNVVLLDPTNGGMLIPCKTFIYRYFFKDPPDVGIEVYFNGTQVTTPLARHATVVLRSNVDQKAAFTATLIVGAHKGLQTLEFRKVTLAENKNVTIKNGVAYEIFDIQEYVNDAIRYAREHNVSTFVQVDAWIVSAEYNYRTENDRASARYYPPLSLREMRPVKLTVEVLDILRMTPVQGAWVEIHHVDTGTKEAGTTNASGMVTFNTYSGLHYINVTASGYRPTLERLLVDNDMKKTVYLTPLDLPPPPPPPLNTTEPPYVVNETVYWWLSVQCVYADGYPFAGAHVLIKDVETGEILASLETDGTGYVHVLVRNNTLVSINVTAVNPMDQTQVYSEERSVLVVQHTWVVFQLPWWSPVFEPEVAVTNVMILVHYGLGYYYGNVTHTVLIELWSNIEQEVELLVEIINSEGEIIGSQQLNLFLEQGITEIMTFFSINASEGMLIRARAEIVFYEYDTDPSNNVLYSDWVYLKPFFNAVVEVFWVPVRLQSMFSVIPEDEILVAVRITVTTNTTTLPLTLTYSLWMYDLEERRMKLVERKVFEGRFPQKGTYWINFTTTVPWSNFSLINVFAYHELDLNLFDNNASTSVFIWPNAKLMEFKVRTPFVMEGSEVSFFVKIRTNVPEEEKMNLAVTVSSVTVNEVIAIGAVHAKPWVELELKGKAPLNPRIGFFNVPILPRPMVTHDIECYIAGYDVYEADNSARATLVVTANYMYWLIIIAIIIFFLIFFRVFVLAVHDVHTGRFVVRKTRRREKYVQRVSDRWGENEKNEKERRKFVRRKDERE
ncbi:MAG: hypothetical protein QXU26_02850 [Thermofilaceae archaeon]